MENVDLFKIKYVLQFLIVFLLGVLVGIPATYFFFEKKVETLTSSIFVKLSKVEKTTPTDNISLDLDVSRKKFVIGKVTSIDNNTIKIDTSNDVNYFQYKKQGYMNVLVSSSTKFNEFTPKKENKNQIIDMKSKEDNFFSIVEVSKEKISVGDKVSAIVEGEVKDYSVSVNILNILR